MKLLITFISMLMLLYSREASLSNGYHMNETAGIIYVLDTASQIVSMNKRLSEGQVNIEKVDFEILNSTEEYPKKVLLSQYLPPSEHASRTKVFKQQLNDFSLVPMEYWSDTNYSKLVGEFEEANSIYIVFSEDLNKEVVAIYKVLVNMPEPLLVTSE